jgi:hypothetical protein
MSMPAMTSNPRRVDPMSDYDDEVAAALEAGGDEENVQRVTIVDDDPERAKRIAEALALDSDEAPPATS